MAILFFFSREFVSITLPKPQVVDTWGFNHQVQFRLKSLSFKSAMIFKLAAMTSYEKRVSRQNCNFITNLRILTKFDMYVHMDVLSDLMLFSNYKMATMTSYFPILQSGRICLKFCTNFTFSFLILRICDRTKMVILISALICSFVLSKFLLKSLKGWIQPPKELVRNLSE